MNVHQMRHVVRDLLSYIGARILIIDEVHAFLASTYRQQRILLNTLRYMANELRIPLVCAGTADAKIALTTDEQLADRFEAFELPLWQNDEAFIRLLASFQSVSLTPKLRSYERQFQALTSGSRLKGNGSHRLTLGDNGR